MGRKLYYLVGILVVIFGWQKYRQAQSAALDEVQEERPAAPDITYQCDGRVYCSQMRSCEEARWFLQHCPGTKMDGDHDGIPCEDQFCGH